MYAALVREGLKGLAEWAMSFALPDSNHVQGRLEPSREQVEA